MKRMLRAALSLAAMTASLGAANAAPIPWSGEDVDIVARERALPDVLSDVFAAEGLTATFSSRVEGELSGEFAGEAADVWAQLADAYGLIAYYDGTAVRVYVGAEADSRMYNLAPDVSREVRRVLAELGLADEANTAQVTSNGVLSVRGTPRFLEAVNDVVTARGLARTADDATMTFEVFPLRYAWAQDTVSQFGSTEVKVPGIATIVRGLVAAGPGVSVEVAAPERGARVGVARSGLADSGVVDVAAVRAQEGNPFAVRRRRAMGDQGAVTTMTAPPLPPGVRIEADPRQNAVIVRDRPERMAIYRSLIEQLDKQPKIVAIEATIVDVDTDRLREVGVQWRYGTEDFDGTLGGRLTGGLSLSPQDFLNPFSSGLLASGVVGDQNQLTARVAALEAEGLARVVSSPQVMTLANVEAVFNNTRTFFVRVPGQFDAALFDVTVGTSLSVTPHVVEEEGEELVKLLVNVQDGRQTGTSVEGIPTIETSGVGTQGLMRVGQSLLLGGLTVDRSESFEEGVPVLRSIPLLGRAFKQTSTRSGRVERMFLLTPRLVTPGGNVAVDLDSLRGPAAAPSLPGAPVRGRADPRVEVSYTPGEADASDETREVSAAANAPAPTPEPAAFLRPGGLFSGACDDLDPYADCGGAQ